MFFLSLFCSPWLHLFDKKYNKNSNIVKYYFNFKELFSIRIYLKHVIYSCDQTCIFIIITHMILQKSLEYDDLMIKRHF